MGVLIQSDVLAGMTPAHTYSSTTDFEAILSDISRDLVPTGTKQPFPVVWESDFEENEFGLRLAGNMPNPFKKDQTNGGTVWPHQK